MELTKEDAKKWILGNWDKLDKERKLLSTVARWITKFGVPKKEETKEEIVEDLVKKANEVFGQDKL